ncbi:MAG: hypothetical protein R3C59_11780 [Planctomycetaceae bacterium]
MNDTTGRDVRSVADDSIQYRIRSSQYGEVQGMSFDTIPPERNNIELSGYSRNRSATLEIDFNANEAHIRIGTQGTPTERFPINRTTVETWMSRFVSNVESPESQKQIDNLSDVIGVMSSTRGLTSRLGAGWPSVRNQKGNPEDRSIGNFGEWYPTLREPLAEILRDRWVISNRLIPVGRLLNPELFDVPSQRGNVTCVISPNGYFVSLYLFAATLIWLIGLVRVLRVLYRHLWQSAMHNTADAASQSLARSHWQRCSLALIVNGLFACLISISVFSATGLLNDNKMQADLLNQLSIPVPPSAFELAVLGMVFVSMAITVGALLARPFLKSSGRWIGLVAATLAIITLPLSLITFPSGLAAWILLTDPITHAFFKRPEQTSSLNL